MSFRQLIQLLGCSFIPLFWFCRLHVHKWESNSSFSHQFQQTPHIRDLQAGPGRAGREWKIKYWALAKSQIPWQLAALRGSLSRVALGMFAAVSGCFQPLQIRLCAFIPRLCFRDHLCWCVCLGRHYFPKWRLKSCGIIMAITDDSWSKIQKWHWQVLGVWADLDVRTFKKKPLKVRITRTSLTSCTFALPSSQCLLCWGT